MSQELIKTLKRHEGVRRYVYKDHLGYETIGVGRCLVEGIGIGLSDDEIEYMLANDIARCAVELSKAFNWFQDLNTVRREAMINLCFNLGLTRLLNFKRALAAMRAKDYAKAAEEFLDSRWADQVGQRAIEVTDMIRSGQYAES